jgi:hypothetical protein
MTTVWRPEIMHMHITNHVTIFRKMVQMYHVGLSQIVELCSLQTLTRNVPVSYQIQCGKC